MIQNRDHVILIFMKSVFYVILGLMELDIKANFTGVTMTLPLSLNRMDRLYLHLDRWKGPMSIAVQVNEEDLVDLIQIVNAIRRDNIRFTFYIVIKPIESNYRCIFKSLNGTDVLYESCYVINVLRNLAIETIKTSHFMIIDGDGIISC